MQGVSTILVPVPTTTEVCVDSNGPLDHMRHHLWDGRLRETGHIWSDVAPSDTASATRHGVAPMREQVLLRTCTQRLNLGHIIIILISLLADLIGYGTIQTRATCSRYVASAVDLAPYESVHLIICIVPL